MFDYWQQQTDKPLFEDLVWSRPENKNQLPKIAIVGGSKQGFIDSFQTFEQAEKVGCGDLKLVLPDSLKNNLPKNDTRLIFVKSNKNGAFSDELLTHLKALSSQANLITIADDIGRDSMTWVAIDSFLKLDLSDVMLVGKSCISNDVMIDTIISRQRLTTFVVNQQPLQKVASRLPTDTHFLSTDQLTNTVQKLHALTTQLQNIMIIATTSELVIIAYKGQIYSTKLKANLNQLAGVASAYYQGDLGRNIVTGLYS